ncbi:MAG: MerR family DNA-binding transcriptional regulator, partial [Acidimicrobiales bacterium]
MARTLTAGKVADELGVRPVTVRKWASEGRIPCDRTAGGHRRFSLDEVLVATGRGAALVNELVPFLRGEIERWALQPLNATLFGSTARGNEHAYSDIDLLIVVPQLRSVKQRRVFGEQMVQLHFATDERFHRDLREVEFDLVQLEGVARGTAGL